VSDQHLLLVYSPPTQLNTAFVTLFCTHRLTALNEELNNKKGELSTLQAQLNVWTAAPAVLESALPDFLRRTSDKMQANANVSAVASVCVCHSSLCLAQQSVFVTAVCVWHSSLCLSQQSVFVTAVCVCHSTLCLAQFY
jgi:hypothetical protein